MTRKPLGVIRRNDRGRPFIEAWAGGERYRLFTIRGISLDSESQAKTALDDIRLRVERGEPAVLVLSSLCRAGALVGSSAPVGSQEPWKEEYRKRMLVGATRRARETGMECNITLEDIVIPNACPILGIKLSPTEPGGGRSDFAPSLDRLVSTRGYLKGNIAVISWRANRIKNNATAAELKKLAAWIEYFDHCPPLIEGL